MGDVMLIQLLAGWAPGTLDSLHSCILPNIIITVFTYRLVGVAAGVA